MSIGEAIAILKEHQKILNVDKGIEFFQEIRALNMAIETMYKHQKIQEIINNTDYIQEDVIRYKMICEVMNNGNAN